MHNLNHLEAIGTIYQAKPGSTIGKCLDELIVLMQNMRSGESITLLHNATEYTVSKKTNDNNDN